MHTTKFIRGMAITVGIVAGTTTAAGALAGGGIDSSPTVTVKHPPVPTTVTQYFIGPSTTAPLPHLDGSNPVLHVTVTTSTTLPPLHIAIDPAITVKVAESTTTIKHIEPVPTSPKPVETPTIVKPTEPSSTTVATTVATSVVTTEPTPTTVATRPETPAPANLRLDCGKAASGTVTCGWSGGLPVGATHFMLLRTSPGQNRMLLSSASATSYTDSTAKVGVAYVYLVVAMPDSGSSLGHSNQVSIVG